MKRALMIAAVAAGAMIAASGMAYADSISSVENARAKERAGDDLDREDRENLRKYGRTSQAGDAFTSEADDDDDRDDRDDDDDIDDDRDDDDDRADAAAYVGPDAYGYRD